MVAPDLRRGGREVGQAQFRVLADCPTCRVQGAVVEVVSCRGVELEQREATCRLCGHRERSGRCVRDGTSVSSPEQARALLGQWSAREGEPDLGRFLPQVFGLLDLAGVTGLLLVRAEVPTRLDPLEWLRPESLVGDGGHPQIGPIRTGHRPTRYRPAPPRPPGSDPTPPRRVTARALVAVLAGGRPPRAEVRRFLDRLLGAVGKPPLDDADLRPWRAILLPCPEDPEPILEVMAELAEIERRRGPGPWSVVKDFARAWGVPLAPLEQRAIEVRSQRGAGVVRLWYRLRDLLAADPG